jgi:glutathione reductase (NADPH)
MAKYDYDLFVIGGGSGGVRAARMSAQHGARVAFVYGSHFSADCEEAAGFGWTVEKPSFDWKRLIANKDAEIARLNGVYRNLLEGAGVEVIDGRGTFADAHTVEVGGKPFSAEHILIATGGWPFIPEFPGREHVITSNEAFHLEDLPARVVIAGGGYIAVEFASIFHGYGAEVTQLYRGPLFLRGFDDDVRGFLADEMGKKGIDLRFNLTIDRIEKTSGGLQATLSDGTTLETDCVMCATGRSPNTARLGLEKIGVELAENGAVIVDDRFRTSVPHIYALGDVIDRVALTPVALAEGMAVAAALFGGKESRVSYENIATSVFSQPPIGTVGLTEEEARSRYGAVDIYKSTFTPLKHTLSGSSEKTLMKLIVDRQSDRVVGCHMVGPDAGEIMQGIAIAMKCGATKAQLDATIGIHPTAAEEFVTMRTAEPEPAQAVAG